MNAGPVPSVMLNGKVRECLCLVGDQRFRLVHADPPWSYRNSARDNSWRSVGGRYSQMTMPEILSDLDAAYDAAERGSVLVVWCTNPLLAEWMDIHRGMRWTYRTAGAWGKTGRVGVGYYLRGDSEPFLVYTKGRVGRSPGALSGLVLAPREGHSVKPAPAMHRFLEAFAPKPEHRVLDLYAGSAPMREACAKVGRVYVGIDDGAQWTPHEQAAGLT